MKTRLFTGFILLILLSAVISSCKKDTISSDPIPVSPISNNWQCQIDGIVYSGTVDTSITHISTTGNDTTLFFTGTSNDKKNNILFSITLNRASSPTGILSSNFSISFLYINTDSAYYLTSPYSSTSAMLVKINSFASNQLQATFSGSINDLSGNAHTITNGKISCAIGQGDNEPKNFYLKDDTTTIAGYIDYARLCSNSLIINGTSITNSGQKFKLIVHTGGTIKTGTYQSINGDVGLQLSQQGQFIDYINDTIGNLTVNINSVQGNIVTGTFSGTTVANGRFSCRVINYMPETDSVNTWRFAEDDSIFNYNIYSGNTISTSFEQDGPKYYFTLNGESDNGNSVFKLRISDYHPIDTVLYQTGYMYTAHVDSMYFRSATKTSDTTSTYLYMHDDDIGYCNIDTLDDHHIVGTLYGKIEVSLGPAGFISTNIKKATFRAAF